MTRSFTMPDLGEGLVEAEVVSWLVAPGDPVAIDQPVVELESAKSVVQLPSPFAGIVQTLGGDVGQVLHAGDVLLTLAEPSDAEAEPSDESGAVLIGYGTRATTASTRPRRTEGRFGRPGPQQAPGVQLASPAAPSTPVALLDSGRRSPVLSPIVRRLAREHGFDASRLLGSGPDHLVLRRDVERAIAERAQRAQLESAEAPPTTGASLESAPVGPRPATRPPAAPEPSANDQRVPLDRHALTAAAHFERSRREIPDATVWVDVDATGLLTARRELEQTTGERFGVTALIARFAVAGLARHPKLNASFDTERRELVLHGAVNLGIATQTARGLMVPVVHGADAMPLRGLRSAIADRATQASSGVFPPDALLRGTFTLNNYGALGVDGSAAILNYPEAAMLGVGRLMARPWVVDGELAVRTVTELTLSFDHRVCDGAEAAAFLTFVAGCIERPLTLLAEM
jgi:pyruvate/2-oxoglutarate dehydrogenase complex dihydrolipoamide acyltransferase (E2) component